ncbi:MAG: thioredoxin domain-containing protein [Polyangiaceae bacterium]|nr:thioredoxin domain-containing protein [Polyangiaceae bacterium]
MVAPDPAPTPATPRWAAVVVAVLALALASVVAVVGTVAIRRPPPPRPSAVATAAPLPPPAPPASAVEPAPREASSGAAPPIAVRSLADDARAAEPGPDADAILPIDAGRPVVGSPSASVTLAVFADLECPHTRATLRELPELRARHGARLRIAWFDRPLAGHPNAHAAARVGRGIARDRGAPAFFRYVERLLDAGEAADRGALERAAAGAGAVAGDTTRYLADPSLAERVDRDDALGKRLGVRETPALLANGLRVDGHRDAESLTWLLRAEADTTRFARAAGGAVAASYARRVEANLIGVGEAGPLRVCVAPSELPRRGAPRGLTITLLTTYGCESCRQADAIASALERRRPDEVGTTLAFLPAPPGAGLAASVVRAVARRDAGRAWSVHARLVQAADLGEPALERALRDAGIEPAPVLTEARAAAAADRDAEAELARELGVRGAPVLLVEGRLVSPTAEVAGAVLDEERARAVGPRERYAAACAAR